MLLKVSWDDGAPPTWGVGTVGHALLDRDAAKRAIARVPTLGYLHKGKFLENNVQVHLLPDHADCFFSPSPAAPGKPGEAGELCAASLDFTFVPCTPPVEVQAGVFQWPSGDDASWTEFTSTNIHDLQVSNYQIARKGDRILTAMFLLSFRFRGRTP